MGANLPMTKNLGRKHTVPAENLILLLLDTHSSFAERLLRSYGYDVAIANTPDHAVALCMSNPVRAIIIDQCLMGSAEGWSLAQSIKMVKADLPVVLLCHGPIPQDVQLPAAVDDIVSDSDVQGIVTALKRHIKDQAAAAQS